jgi:ATP-dependent helicase HrpA
LTSLEKRVEASVLERKGRLARKPTVTYPQNLPITPKRDEIIHAIKENPVVIISGETGSGKSTQIPKMCLDAGRGIGGKIGCTQPRRIAATTIGRRIAEELGEEIGKSVGYKIRFRDKTHPDAYIKIMTDGMLLAETQGDPLLSEYDALIIDEAHERSLNIDFLLGILKTLLINRSDLKLIITSATLDTEKFSKAFDSAPVVEVTGRLYPVEVEYMPIDHDLEDAGEITYVDMAVRAVDTLRAKRGLGDILVFLPTEQDILETCERLEGHQYPGTTILPLFARLPGSHQGRVYSVSGPKIVVATNVAETSLTIPGIKYVIDTGLARISRYQPRTRTTSLPISPISQSSADQRKGRCGRVQHGICIRLYTQEDYDSRPVFTPPEILRSNLAEVILRMLFLKLGNINSFPFVDRPNQRSIKDGFDLLVELGAIVKDGREFSLTENGRIMARMPMDPKISRMLLEAHEEGCVREVAVIASALSIQDPRERPLEKASQADQVHAPFRDPDSDFLTLLKIWKQYHRTWKTLKTQNKMRKFCKQHFLSFPRMREWVYIHEQITTILKERKIGVGRGGVREISESLYAGIHKSILSGYLSNIALQKDKNIYRAARGREAMIFPGSTLFNKGRPWIVAAEMVKTSRLFARTTARIDNHWLEALGGNLCRYSYFEPHWEKSRGEVRAYEQVILYGLVIIPKRRVSYGPIDQEESHKIFIQSGLVEENVKEPFQFLTHNRNLVKRLTNMEDKVRRRDILVSEMEVADFYSRKLGGIYDIRSLKRIIIERGGDDFLKLEEQDLLLYRPDKGELAQFPDRTTIGPNRFGFSYKFAPGDEEDGVTISIPSSLASRIPVERIEWGVPGLFREKVTALIKGLPKQYRKQLVPVSRTVDVIMEEMEKKNQSLLTTLAQFIYHRYSVDIPASAWSSVEIPDHLKMRVSITDHRGRALRSGRDFGLLKGSDAPPQTGIDSAEWKKALAKDLRFLKKNLTLPAEGIEGARYFGGVDVIQKALYDGLLQSLFKHDLRSREEFNTHVEFVKSEMFTRGKELRDQVIKVLDAYHQTRSILHTVEKANSSNRGVLTLCVDIREDLDSLVPKNFIEIHPIGRFIHILRYLKAMRIRTERGAYAPEKDRKKTARAEGFIKALHKMLKELSPHASLEKKEALEAYRWMVEEFKVSLFAQELKTPFPISEKRLEEKRREIERMV